MNPKVITKILVILYFFNLLLYSFFSFIDAEGLIDIFWFIRIPILLILYFVSSVKRNILYIIALLLYQSASVFFRSGTSENIIYGTFSSVFFKLCLLLLIIGLVTRQNYKAVSIASIPFFVIYLYIIEMVVSALGDTYYIWTFNAFLTSVLGGIAIINYVNYSGEKNYWLLLSAILFIVQIAAFFINKFYVKNEAVYQVLILSYGISHFAFYKFMILNEEEQLQLHS